MIAETPSQKLAAVLAKIAEIEQRDGYDGYKISDEIESIRWIADDFGEQQFDDDDGTHLWFPRQWIGDIIVGAVSRGCDRWGWRFFTSGSWWGEELDFYRAHITDRDSALVATAEGASRALAALLAWEAAISSEKAR